MTKENLKEHLTEYANLKIETAIKEERMAQLNLLISEEMKKQEVDEINLEEMGKFSLYMKRKWLYPAEVKSAEEAAKKLKAEAEAKGTATYEESSVLKFSPLKISEE